MTTLVGSQIQYARLCARIGALELEIKGMKRRGQSVYAICKQEYTLNGSKAAVLKKLQQLKERMLKEAKCLLQ